MTGQKEGVGVRKGEGEESWIGVGSSLHARTRTGKRMGWVWTEGKGQHREILELNTWHVFFAA